MDANSAGSPPRAQTSLFPYDEPAVVPQEPPPAGWQRIEIAGRLRLASFLPTDAYSIKVDCDDEDTDVATVDCRLPAESLAHSVLRVTVVAEAHRSLAEDVRAFVALHPDASAMKQEMWEDPLHGPDGHCFIAQTSSSSPLSTRSPSTRYRMTGRRKSLNGEDWRVEAVCATEEQQAIAKKFARHLCGAAS